MQSNGKTSRGSIAKRRRNNNSKENIRDETPRHTDSCSCTFIRVTRSLLVVCGIGSIIWTQLYFDAVFEAHPQKPIAAGFQEAFSEIRPRFSSKNKSVNQSQSKEKERRSESGRSLENGLLRNANVNVNDPSFQYWQTSDRRKTDDKEKKPKVVWDIPTSPEFNEAMVQQKISQWRQTRIQASQTRQEQQLENAAQLRGKGIGSTAKIIPFLHKLPMFQRRLDHELMVVVMADPECPLVFPDAMDGTTKMVNATKRFLLTLEDALQTQYANVIAYLPHYSGREDCREELFHAVVHTFESAWRTGQLQIVSPPQRQTDRGPTYKFAQHGLDFAYAAELGHQYSDLCLFLQAGTRLLKDWWIRYVAVPEGEQGGNPVWDDTKNATVFMKPQEATSIRDYGKEILIAYEGRLRYDEYGQTHDLCYMNFARGVKFQDKRYVNMENPTGALFTSKELLRLSLVLRSYLPYGKSSVSKLLDHYCSNLVWEADSPNGPLKMFQYSTTKAKESKTVDLPLLLVGKEDNSLPKGITYPYMNIPSSEVPTWVKIGADMIGPHPMSDENPLLVVADGGSKRQKSREKVWMTFAIPTAWRPATSDGNGYVVECVRQLTAIIQEYFQGEYKAKILLVVTGQTETDQQRHYDGLESIFSKEIRSGTIELIQAPLSQYPTLHGLPIHYKDTESRVRWRSKQNLDISMALFAAKGHGKYVMTIEDDSGFRPNQFFKAIRQTLGTLIGVTHNGVTNNTSSEVSDESMLKNNTLMNFDSLTTTGHVEHWSQVRFAFGYSGLLLHDEDAFVFGLLYFLFYQEKPCDLITEKIADAVRTGVTKDHYLRWNKKFRAITHLGRISTLNGREYDSDKEIVK